MSKVTSPKAWYLLGIGAVALAADGTRRLIKRRRRNRAAGDSATFADIPVVATEPAAGRSAPPVEAVVAPAAPAPTKEEGGPDDLTVLNGVGPVFAKRLIEAGYRSFADIANADPEALREATKATRLANPEEWIAEAGSRL